MKKIIIASLSIMLIVMVSSCGSSAECPAYSQATPTVEASIV